MYEKWPSKHLNWLPMINNQLLSDSQRTLNDTILIHNPLLLEGLYKVFVDLEEKFIANVLATGFMIGNSEYYTAYSFTLEDAKKRGSNRAYQRFEQCLNFFYIHMRPALEAFNAVEFYDRSVQKSATELVELAVGDAIEEISGNEKIANETRNEFTKKLKSAELWVMFPDVIVNLSKIDGLYKELDLEGTESLIEMSTKIKINSRKLQMKPKDHWLKILHTVISEDKPSYFAIENIFYIPVQWTLYPNFHPNRSRFFNMATLYGRAVNYINVGLKDEFPDVDLSELLPEEEMIDRSYVRWEASGGVDRQLPSFKLTNRQMLWVCMAHQLSKKYHRKTPKHVSEYIRIVIDHLNIYLKRMPSFRKAFECGNLTSIEEEQVKELKTLLAGKF